MDVAISTLVITQYPPLFVFRIVVLLASVRGFNSFPTRYVVREPWDRQWGVFAEETGNWTGIVGTLQYEKADLSLGVGPTSDRLQVMEHSRVYSPEPFVIVSLKPQPLPQYLALIRPYEGMIVNQMSLVWYSIEEQYEIPFVIYLFEGIHYRYIMVILNYQASKSSSVHISNAFNTDKDQILKIYLR